LARVAAKLQQATDRVLALNPLGRGLKSESVAKAHDRLDDARLLRLLQHLPDKGAVDLDRIELKLAQMIEARIAGAEIVQRDAHADIAQFLKRGLGILQALHHRAFSDLDHQPIGRKRGSGENIQDSRRP